MARDITVHFIGNARDLAASSAVAEASVDRFGNATVEAAAKADVAGVAFSGLLVPLIGIAAVLAVLTAPLLVLTTTFAVLGGGLIGLAYVTGYLKDEFALLIQHVQFWANVLGAQAAPLAENFLEALDKLIPVVADLGGSLIQWFAERIPAMLPIFTQIVQVLAAAVLGLASAWGVMVDFFLAHWTAYSNAIGSVFSQIGTGVHFALPLLGLVHEAFVRLGPVIQLIQDHADSLKPLLYVLGGLFVAMAASVMLTVAAILLVVAAIVAVASAISFAIAHVHSIADAFWSVVHAAEAAAGAIGHVRDQVSNIPVIGGVLHSVGIPGFQAGGVVPGPLGAPMLAMVHGGEVVTPPGRSPSGTTYNINVAASPLASPAETGRAVVAAIQEYERRSGTAWRS